MTDERQPVRACCLGTFKPTNADREDCVEFFYRLEETEEETEARIFRHAYQMRAQLLGLFSLVSHGELFIFYTRGYLEYEGALFAHSGKEEELVERVTLVLRTSKMFLKYQGRFITMGCFSFSKTRRLNLSVVNDRHS